MITKHFMIFYFLKIAGTLGTNINNSFVEYSQLISYRREGMLAQMSRRDGAL